jgi:hypothetical protein
MGTKPPKLVLTRWVGHVKRNAMRVVELRLLLAIVVVLLGATLIVGLNFGEDDDPMALVCQTQPLHVNAEERSRSSLDLLTSDLLTSAPRPARTESEITAGTSASVIDLVCVLRC